MKIVKSYGDSIYYSISESDYGVSDAWNKGLKKIRGDWILFLGADDYLWEKESLKNSYDILMTLPKKNLIAYFDVLAVDNNSNILEMLSSKWDRNRFYHIAPYFSHQGVFHRKSCFEEYGHFNLDFKFSMDYEFLLRVLKKNNPIYIGGNIISAMETGGMSNNPKNAFLTVLEFRKSRKLNGISEYKLFFLLLLIYSFFKKIIYYIVGKKQYYKLVLKIKGIK